VQYVDYKNKGLSQNFSLESGKFFLEGGPDKALDGIYFWLSFSGFFRVYSEDFPPEILQLLQSTTSYVQVMKGLILGRLQESAEKYLPFVRVSQLNLDRIVGDRKGVVLGISFDYKLEQDTQLQTVTFIEV
jgi:hypothetical protein